MADQHKQPAFSVHLTLSQIALIILASYLILTALSVVASMHYIMATSYTLDRSGWRCTKAKK